MFLKLLGLVFACFGLSLGAFGNADNITPLVLDDTKPTLRANDDDLVNSFINDNNEVIISKSASEQPYFTSSIFSFINTYLDLYGTSTDGRYWFHFDGTLILANDTSYPLSFYVQKQDLTYIRNIHIYPSGNAINDVIRLIYDSSGNFLYFNHPYTDDYSLVFPLYSTYDFGSYFLDYVRSQSNNFNPYDIHNYGFKHNYVYQFDTFKFINNYNNFISSYVAVYYSSNNTTVSYTSNGSFYSYNDSGNTTCDITKQLQFPFSCLIGDMDTTDTELGNFKYVFNNNAWGRASTNYEENRSFFTIGYDNNQSYYYANNVSGEFLFNGVNGTWESYPQLDVKDLYLYRGTHGAAAHGEFDFTKRYLYFICDNPYLFNGFITNLYTSSDENIYGETLTGVASAYFGDYRVKDIHRYGNYASSNYITDLYYAYIDSFTCLGAYDTDSLNYVYTDFVTYLNDGNISSYYDNTYLHFNFTIHKVGNDVFFYNFLNGENYNYIDVYLFNRLTNSYVDIPLNTDITYNLTNYSIVSTSLGTCIRLSTNGVYTLDNLYFGFTINGKSYNTYISYKGYSSFIDVPIEDKGSFYDYMFAIFDSPLFMVSQFFVLPFNFDVLGVLLSLMGFAVVLFIVRLII